MGPGHRSPTQHVKPPVSHPAVSSKRQSRQDLAPVKAGERISDWSEERLASATETGRGYGVGVTFPRLASATQIPAMSGLGEIKGKTPRHFGRGTRICAGALVAVRTSSWWLLRITVLSASRRGRRKKGEGAATVGHPHNLIASRGD